MKVSTDSTAFEDNAEQKFEPYVAEGDLRPESTAYALLTGVMFAVLFGAVTVYIGLSGLTIGAAIPAAVLSISLLRVLGKKSILENNIIQTTGSAGESVAGGAIFTLPAFIFLGFELSYIRIVLLAVLGGMMGILFTIPLRRQLIVKEHGKLRYPEGNACADVLVAGDRRDSITSRVFWGLGLGGLYTLFQNANLFAVWPSGATYSPAWLSGAFLRVNTAPEYLGVGYIIGSRIAGVLFSGSVFAWLVVMPAIQFFGSGHAIYPETRSIDNMSFDEIRNLYLAPMGAGAVAAAGIITLIRTIPTILTLTRARLRILATTIVGRRRLERDLDIRLITAGSCIPVIGTWIMLVFYPVSTIKTGIPNILAAGLVTVFGFLFIVVSSRITGLIGSSSNPISGMAIASLLATCILFRAFGWTEPAFFALALIVGAAVCIAAANAGNSAQALKTGFLLGATPAAQQVALLIGISLSAIVVGITFKAINVGLEEFTSVNLPMTKLSLDNLPSGVTRDTSNGFNRESVYVITGILNKQPITARRMVKDLVRLSVVNSPIIPDGQYFLNPRTGYIEIRWIQGMRNQKILAPQARLVATVISGVLTRKLPLRLILLGVFAVIAVELLGIQSLPFAVGFYIPIETTLAIFCGGGVRWLVERGTRRAQGTRDAEVGSGSLYASGLVAAGGIVGLLGIAIKLMEEREWIPHGVITWGSKIPFLRDADWISVVAFTILAFSLFHFAKTPMATDENGGGRKSRNAALGIM